MVDVLHNVSVVLPGRIQKNGIVAYNGAGILYAGDPGGYTVPGDARKTDGKGLYAGPGFIDIHCHGFVGRPGGWAGHQPREFAAYHLAYGTTSVLAAVSAGEGPEHITDRIKNIKTAMRDGSSPSIAGIMLECYFTNFDYGSPSYYDDAFDTGVDAAREIFECGEGLIKLMTVSPELPGIEAIMALAQQYGIVLAAGHTQASPGQLYGALQYGLRVATHHYCATGYPPCYGEGFERATGTRMAGIDEAVDVCDDIYAEIIPDCEGRHVHPIRCRLALRCKGEDRIIIITDTSRAEGEPAPLINNAGDADYHLRAGVLSGSLLTMSKACYNMRRHTGASVESIFKMAGLNPARVLGMTDRGELTPGKRADIVLCDDDFNVHAVVLNGKTIRAL